MYGDNRFCVCPQLMKRNYSTSGVCSSDRLE